MTARLRYTGVVPRTFMGHGVGEVEPGAEFSVPDDAVDAYLLRSDVEAATKTSETDPTEELPDSPPEKAVRKAGAKAPPPTPEGDVSPE